MNRLRKKVYSLLNQVYYEYDRIRDYYRDKHLIRDLNLPKLSRKEKQEIKRTWPCFKFSNLDFIWMRIYKAEHGFDPYYLCDHQYAQLLKIINRSSNWASLNNKALSDVYMPKIPWPKVYLRRINKKYYDNEMTEIGFEQAVALLQSQKQFVIKPATGTGGGKGVKVIDNYLKQEEISELFAAYDVDFVVQTLIVQSSELSRFNPTSVNTCRITTISIGSKQSFSAIFKVGRKNARVDNWNSSVLIGVDKQGRLADYGYDVDLKRFEKSDIGVPFAGNVLPKFTEMVELTLKYHNLYFPNVSVVGWDITLENNDDIVVIETNPDFPGILGEQVCSGTFFKEFRDEICDAVNKRHKNNTKK